MACIRVEGVIVDSVVSPQSVCVSMPGPRCLVPGQTVKSGSAFAVFSLFRVLYICIWVLGAVCHFLWKSLPGFVCGNWGESVSQFEENWDPNNINFSRLQTRRLSPHTCFLHFCRQHFMVFSVRGLHALLLLRYSWCVTNSFQVHSITISLLSQMTTPVRLVASVATRFQIVSLRWQRLSSFLLAPFKQCTS